MQLIRHLLVLVVFVSFSVGTSFAQDIHFTQYDMSPLTLNPAHTGKFGGSIRVGGIYRNQWASILNSPFSTPSAWVDAPIIRGFRKQDWVGVGLMFFSDKVSGQYEEENGNILQSTITHNGIKFSAGYHLGLDKKGKNVLSIGAQYGQESRNLDGSALFEEKILNGGITDVTKFFPAGAGAKGNNTGISAGVIFTSKMNKTMDMSIGFSMLNLNSPKYNLYTGSGTKTAKLPVRNVFHGRFNVALNEKWDITPTFLFQTMAGADEIMLQGKAGYLWDKQKNIRFNGGLGYRLGDAVNLLLGAQYKDLQIGLAYDITTSDLATVNSNRGGFELAANYIFKIYKPAVVKPKIICPRF